MSRTSTLTPRGQRLRANLGEGIRRARRDKGLKVRDVCYRAGVSLGYWCEIERGQKQASFDVLDRVCAALDVDMARLFSYMFKDDDYDN